MTQVSPPISPRALAILARFPRHLDAARPEKLFAAVVHALEVDLELQTSQLGRIRRAHRLGNADELRDLLLLAAAHDLRPADFGVLARRFAGSRARAADLAAATEPAARATARTALASLAGAGEATFTAFPGEADDALAVKRLAAAVLAATGYAAETDRLRRRIAVAIAIHREGNGTIGALLRGAANALDLDVDAKAIRHSVDGFWHLAPCTDRVLLTRPEPPGGPRAATVVPPAVELVALEENPFAHREVDPFAVHHQHLFTITRSGFDAVPVSIHVTGVADHTMWPMVVDRDAGLGVAFHGAVADGAELVFARDGSATLAGNDVGGDAWGFQGAVFALDGEGHARDFRFTDDAGHAPDGQPAAFATAVPFAAAFDPDAVWPHAAGDRPISELAVGPTRWAFFVRQAHFGSTDSTGSTAVPAAAYFVAGVWDESVLAGSPLPDAGKVSFDWEEREPFAARILIPERFAALDSPSAPPTTEVVRGAIERYRAAGIRLTVEHFSGRWTLGEGILRDADSGEPVGIILDGTTVERPALPS